MKKCIFLLSVLFLFYTHAFSVIGELVDFVNWPVSVMTSGNYERAKKLTLTGFVMYLLYHNRTLKRDVNRLINAGKELVANKPKSKKEKIKQLKRHLKEWQEGEK